MLYKIACKLVQLSRVVYARVRKDLVRYFFMCTLATKAGLDAFASYVAKDFKSLP
jgi:hypothetical protein